MPDIDKIKLPSGNVYNIKDSVARQAIAGGMSKIIAWNGASTPVVASIPAGVVVTYNGTNYTGTLAAADADVTGFYFVYSGTQEDSHDIYDEYTVVGSGANKSWEKIGDTQLDLSDLGNLAYKDNVTASPSSVTFSGGTTDKVLGSDATFTTTVTPTTTNIKATASGTAVGANGTASAVTGYASPTTDNFVTSVSAEKSNKLVTTTVPNVTGNTDVSIPNVTSAGTASTWSFAMGSGDDAETLIISGENSTAPTLGSALSASKVTLGTAKTVATGAVSSSGSGSAVVTDVTIGETAAAITALGTPTTATVLTGVKVTSQPTVALATGATAGTGVVSVATGITSASTTTNNKDEVTAVTGIGTGTAAAQNLTIS